MITFFNTFAASGIIAVIALVIVSWILMFLGETDNPVFRFLKMHAMKFAFAFATLATLGSLTYSNIFGLPPCIMCWWQRIFMYPQVIVLGLGMYYRDARMWTASVIMSIIGACFSVSHILLQAGIRADTGHCLQNGGVSCTKIDILAFGWLTIPMMCLSLFIGILTFAMIARTNNKTA